MAPALYGAVQRPHRDGPPGRVGVLNEGQAGAPNFRNPHGRPGRAALREPRSPLHRPRLGVAKVEWRPGELYPRVGFIVTNLSRPTDTRGVFRERRSVPPPHEM